MGPWRGFPTVVTLQGVPGSFPGYIDVSVPAYIIGYIDSSVPACIINYIDTYVHAYNTACIDAPFPSHIIGNIDASVPAYISGYVDPTVPSCNTGFINAYILLTTKTPLYLTMLVDIDASVSGIYYWLYGSHGCCLYCWLYRRQFNSLFY